MIRFFPTQREKLLLRRYDMKIGKVWLSALAVSVVLVCFALSAANAQEVPDLRNWESTWFSITAKPSGWEIEGGVISSPSGSAKGFLKLGELTAYSLEAFFYGPISDELVLVATGSCDYVAGSDWDFICELYLDGVGLPSFNARIDTFIRIQGKQNTKTVPISLKSATLKSSGGFIEGYVEEDLPDTLTVGGLTITGTLLNMTTFCKSTKNQGTPPYADCP
jgi:hypothetical protein